MEFTERSFDKDYCKKCRMEGINDKTGLHCPAGRKNHPNSLRATLNTLKNNGTVCSFNPARVHYGIYDLKKLAI
jgi:hypothetical protein